MKIDALILAAGAAVTYAWLCAAVAPVGLALDHLLVTRGNRRAWTILLLASGGGVLWTAVVAAAGLVATVLAPGAALALLLNPVTVPALSVGVVLWSVEIVATARVPRIGRAFEVETALAPLLVARRSFVAAAEREYGAFVIDEAPSEVRPARSGPRRRTRDQAWAA
jgi:hypothetical protein